jgi:hypothetical protein
MIDFKIEFCRTNKCIPFKTLPDKISALKWLGNMRAGDRMFQLVVAVAFYNQVTIIGSHT